MAQVKLAHVPSATRTECGCCLIGFAAPIIKNQCLILALLFLITSYLPQDKKIKAHMKVKVIIFFMIF